MSGRFIFSQLELHEGLLRTVWVRGPPLQIAPGHLRRKTRPLIFTWALMTKRTLSWICLISYPQPLWPGQRRDGWRGGCGRRGLSPPPWCSDGHRWSDSWWRNGRRRSAPRSRLSSRPLWWGKSNTAFSVVIWAFHHNHSLHVICMYHNHKLQYIMHTTLFILFW